MTIYLKYCRWWTETKWDICGRLTAECSLLTARLLYIVPDYSLTALILLIDDSSAFSSAESLNKGRTPDPTDMPAQLL